MKTRSASTSTRVVATCLVSVMLQSGCARTSGHVQATAAPTTSAAQIGSSSAAHDGRSKDPQRGLRDPERQARLARAGLWVGGVAGAFALGFGITGIVSSKLLRDGYAEGMTVEERDRRETLGNVSNGITIGAIAIGVVALATSSIIYGRQFTVCGPLAERWRTCGDVTQPEQSTAISWTPGELAAPRLFQLDQESQTRAPTTSLLLMRPAP